MKTSQKGVEFIKKWEGCQLKPYKCPSGVYTIGYGHTGWINGITVEHYTPGISYQKAEDILKEDLIFYEKAVREEEKRLAFNLNQNQFDALVSFAFNCGTGSLAQLLKNRKKANVIAEAIPLYCKGGTPLKVIEGLKRRRNAEVALFKSPVKKMTIAQVAKEVWEGKWGNGEERKKKLTEAGYNYEKVQKQVNRMKK